MAAGTLTQNIRAMLKAARVAQGRPIMRSLAGVFTLTVTQLESGLVQVSLDRTNTAPTEADWKRVLAHWPEAVPDGVTPRPRKDGRRHALIASWPRPADTRETERA